MQIKQIDALVHPDFYQMSAPYLPLHESQLTLRAKWEDRINSLKDKQDTILLYFSYMSRGKLDQGLKDISSISNKVEQEEINRINRFKEALRNRFILFGWFIMPDNEHLIKTVKSQFTYEPNELKLYVYGEIYEICVFAWGMWIRDVLEIQETNFMPLVEDSMTNKDMALINNWRINHYYD